MFHYPLEALLKKGKTLPRRRPSRNRSSTHLQLEALEDRCVPSVTLVDVNAAGTGPIADGGTEINGVSSDGTKILFTSTSTDIVPGQIDTPATKDLFWRDLTTGQTRLVDSKQGDGVTALAGTRPSTGPGGVILDKGTSTGPNTSSTLTDTTKNWAPGQWQTKMVRITSGNALGEIRFIQNNTATQLNIGTFFPWDPVPEVGSKYEIFLPPSSTPFTTPILSADGLKVAFASNVNANFFDVTIPIDHDQPTGATSDVFVWDSTKTGTASLRAVDVLNNDATTVAGNSIGVDSGGFDFSLSFQANSTQLAFVSNALASTLDSKASPLDTAGTNDIFLRNFATSQTQTVSLNLAGNAIGDEPNASTVHPIVSADGSNLAYESTGLATNIDPAGPADQFGTTDVFVRNLSGLTSRLASVATSGAAVGNTLNVTTTLNAVTSVAANVNVVFTTTGVNLVPQFINNNLSVDSVGSFSQGNDVYERNVLPSGGSTLLVSAAFGNPVASANETVLFNSVTPDGKFVVFTTTANNIAAPGVDPGSIGDVFVRNTSTNLTAVVSLNSAGTTTGNDASSAGSISADGRFIAFLSQANNLAAGVQTPFSPADAAPVGQVYTRDMTLGLTRAISTVPGGDVAGDGASGGMAVYISSNGATVTFPSSASNLTPQPIPPKHVYSAVNPPPSPAGAAAATLRLIVAAPDNNGLRVYGLPTNGGTNLASVRANPFPGFIGQIRTASGDVNNDGVTDCIFGAGPGGGPNILVADGKTGAVIRDFFAFNPAFIGGVYVAAGDVDGDGWSDIIVGADSGGGPNVVAYSGRTGAILANFFGFSVNFSGGVRVAAGDLKGVGHADIITGAGLGGGPNVAAYAIKDGSSNMIASFFAFAPTFTGGVYVSVGDVNNDGTPDFVASTGAGVPTEVRSFSGKNLTSPPILDDFFPFGAAFTLGANTTVKGVFGSINDIVATAGAGGGPVVALFQHNASSPTPTQIDAFFAFDAITTGGLYVG